MYTSVLLLALILANVAIVLNSERMGSSFGSIVSSSFRGGAKAKGKGSSGGKVSSSKKASATKRRQTYDDSDDNDDKDEEAEVEDKKKSRKSSSSKSKSSKSSSKKGDKKGGKSAMQMMPWGGGGGGNSKGKKGKGGKKGGGGSGMQMSFTIPNFDLKDKFDTISKLGQTAYKEGYRRAKVLRSSAFEGLLLKATWPGNKEVPQDILTEIIKHSIPAFKYGRSDGDDDPYYMTLHKLWTKMSERDWRTVVKSLYILHCISRDCSADACHQFTLALKDMSKTRNPKKPDHRYFEVRVISDVDDASAAFENYVRAYAGYVLYRTKNFSAKFSEIATVAEALDESSSSSSGGGGDGGSGGVDDAVGSVSEKKALSLIKKSQQLITLALACGPSESNPITGYSTKAVCLDLRDIWPLYSSLVAPFLTATARHAAYKEPVASDEEIAAMLQFYKDNKDQVDSFLSKQSRNKVYMKLRIKIPSSVGKSSTTTTVAGETTTTTATELSIEEMDARIAALTSISGGFTSTKQHRPTSNTARKVARSLEDREAERLSRSKKAAVESDDDDEEEKDEEDDEEEEDEETDDASSDVEEEDEDEESEGSEKGSEGDDEDEDDDEEESKDDSTDGDEDSEEADEDRAEDNNADDDDDEGEDSDSNKDEDDGDEEEEEESEDDADSDADDEDED